MARYLRADGSPGDLDSLYKYKRSQQSKRSEYFSSTWPGPCFRSGLIGSQSGLVQVQTSAYWLGAW